MWPSRDYQFTAQKGFQWSSTSGNFLARICGPVPSLSETHWVLLPRWGAHWMWHQRVPTPSKRPYNGVYLLMWMSPTERYICSHVCCSHMGVHIECTTRGCPHLPGGQYNGVYLLTWMSTTERCICSHVCFMPLYLNKCHINWGNVNRREKESLFL